MTFRSRLRLMGCRLLLFVAFAFTSQFYVVANGQTCKVTSNADRSIEFKNGQKHFHLLGWVHFSPQDLMLNTNTFMEIHRIVKSGGGCSDISKVVTNALNQEREYLKSAEELYSRIKQIKLDHTQNNIIAIEASEEERVETESNPDSLLSTKHLKSIYQNFSYLKEQCSEIQDDLSKFELALMTPQNFFFVENLNNNIPTQIIGVEDKDLRAKTSASISEETRSFNIENEKNNYSMETWLAIKNLILDFINYSKTPTDALIDSILTKVADEGRRIKTKRVLKEYQTLAKIAEERNKKIAENMMKLDGNVILIIGDAHLHGLVERLKTYCNSASTTSMDSPI